VHVEDYGGAGTTDGGDGMAAAALDLVCEVGIVACNSQGSRRDGRPRHSARWQESRERRIRR